MTIPIFMAGFVGALAPEVVRLYGLRRTPESFQPYYFLISGIYALLGGYVATIAPGVENRWWAFAVGAGLVAVVNTAAKMGDLVVNREPPTTVGPTSLPEGGKRSLAERGEDAVEDQPLRRFLHAL